MIIIVIILVYCNVATICDKDYKFKTSQTSLVRKDCHPSKHEPGPPNRVNTTSRLSEIRKIMEKLEAVLITSDDEHQSEMVSVSDKRREYISGFSGTRGDVIITKEKAALWTDGRYHIQADEELDCNWLLMREGNENVPLKSEWLSIQFPNGGQIGADAKLVPANVWNNLKAQLKKFNKNFTLVPTKHNLVDNVWTDRPMEKLRQAYALDRFFTGKEWTTKVHEVRQKLKKMKADAMVITALDEVAWLLNIRGWDIPYSNFVKSYVIITKNDTVWYVNCHKIKDNVTEFFEQNYPGQLKIRAYNDIWHDLPSYSHKFRNVLAPSFCSYSAGVSKKIYSLIPDKKRLFRPSPIIYLKAKKNPTEVLGMQRAHIRDGAALCRFLHHFERRMNASEVWDEMQLAKDVDKFRKMQDLYVSQSFSTIAAFGPHGALPHYIPTASTSSIIVNDSTIVIDSGGQYYDGTTDVTRTIHIGTPTKEHKEAYTRVLMGAIQLSSLIFPANLTTSAIDVIARAPLWEIGYNYPHGTGHGIGAFLGVHESPISINYYNLNAGTPLETLKPNYFHSNEPGMYIDGKFGIRLENVLQVIKKTTLCKEYGYKFLGFKDATLVPYQKKLIDFSLLSTQHRRWLNKYNTRIRLLVGAELIRQNAMETYKWLLENTLNVPEGGIFT